MSGEFTHSSRVRNVRSARIDRGRVVDAVAGGFGLRQAFVKVAPSYQADYSSTHNARAGRHVIAELSPPGVWRPPCDGAGVAGIVGSSTARSSGLTLTQREREDLATIRGLFERGSGAEFAGELGP